MKNEIIKKHILQQRRKWRVRKKMHGTAARPRLTIMKSNKHLHVQLIDDDKGHTIATVSTAQKQYRTKKNASHKNKDAARKLGEQIGALAVKNDIKEVIFDRGPYKYHGVLAELAEAARQSGLTF